MAVYTKVSKVGIQSILSKYDVGKLIKFEEIQEGIENCPETLNRLFTGQNQGKQMLKI